MHNGWCICGEQALACQIIGSAVRDRNMRWLYRPPIRENRIRHRLDLRSLCRGAAAQARAEAGLGTAALQLQQVQINQERIAANPVGGRSAQKDHGCVRDTGAVRRGPRTATPFRFRSPVERLTAGRRLLRRAHGRTDLRPESPDHISSLDNLSCTDRAFASKLAASDSCVREV